MPQFLVIGNPENRRVRFFQDALRRFSLPRARVLAYEDLLSGRTELASELRSETIVRIESPGENFAVEKLLLAEGAGEAESEGSPAVCPVDLEFDRGRIVHPRQWFLGFRRVLTRWAGELRSAGARVMNLPDDIVRMFDKRECHALCDRHSLPVPPALGPIGSYEELIARMDQTGFERVFVKLAHGSSASGVVAYHRRRGRHEAITSAELVRTAGDVRLYNSLRIRRYTDEGNIRDLMNTLAAERIHVEQWLPKASLEAGESMDVRVVVISGRPRHLVVRQGRSPMTNLHLGNRRGNADMLLARLGGDGREQLMQTCRRAAALFPRSLYAGLDVLFTPGFRRHALLEMNAFGDLIPGVEDEGLDTYSAEMAELMTPFRRS